MFNLIDRRTFPVLHSYLLLILLFIQCGLSMVSNFITNPWYSITFFMCVFHTNCNIAIHLNLHFIHTHINMQNIWMGACKLTNTLTQFTNTYALFLLKISISLSYIVHSFVRNNFGQLNMQHKDALILGVRIRSVMNLPIK